MQAIPSFQELIESAPCLKDQEETPQITAPCRAVLLRHGYSIFNHVTNTFNQRTGLQFFCEEARTLQLDYRLIDCGLCQLGYKQVHKESIKPWTETISLVVCSPLRRALQTARVLLRGRLVKVVVMPELSEILSKISDVSMPMSKKEEQFKDLNLDLSLCKEDPLFQLNCLGNDKAFFKGENEHQLMEYILSLMVAKYPQKLQSSSHCTKRSKLALQKIKMMSQKYKEGIICIITHNRIFKNMAYCRKSMTVPSEVAYGRGYPFELF